MPHPSRSAKKKNIKYIFVTGGVMSGVGKGIASASIGAILQSRGLSVTAVKIDPYVNVDAGTMNPTEHGEVFVLDDGTECDQDMGNYERFLNKSLSGADYMTTGSVYKAVIDRERSMGYGGKCVEVVPHIPLEIIDRITRAAQHAAADVVITEIGGTVGEYQNVLFLEAVRMLKIKHPEDILLVLISYLPMMNDDNEQKTKPTQYAVRALNAAGLQPDLILARAKHPLDKKRKEKIAFNCNLREEDVISAPDVGSVYDIPVNFEKDGVGNRIVQKLGLSARRGRLDGWRLLGKKARTAKKTVTIGIVGKYFSSGAFVLTDAYISVIEAVKHGALAAGVKPQIEWIDSEQFEKNPAALKSLDAYNGIVVPGGFGSRGVEGKIAAIGYCRRRGIPYFGLCYGMQLAVVEYARSVLKMRSAHTTEIDAKTAHPVIDILPEQKKLMAENNYGGTMRLGAWPAVLAKGSIAAAAYGVGKISERHRHRYEVNPEYVGRLQKGGVVFSGTSPDARLMEIMELPKAVHPFFVGTQFHPELLSRPFAPHPLFVAFMKAAAGCIKKKSL